MRKEFYELRNWDPANGLQKADLFDRLGMPDVAKELHEKGLVAV